MPARGLYSYGVGNSPVSGASSPPFEPDLVWSGPSKGVTGGFICIMKLQRLIFFALSLALVPLAGAATVPPLILKGSAATNAPPPAPGVTNTDTNTPAAKNAPSAADRLASPVRDVIQMSDSGVAADVLTSYIQNSPSTFNLKPDDIIYLKDIGLPGGIISAMLAHDKAVRDNAIPQSLPAGVAPPPGGQSPYSPPAQPSADTENPMPQSQNYQPDEGNYFYSYLSPYGTWGNLPGYGSFWQPYAAISSTGWAPYCDNGRWCYSNVGWFWNSNYAWGWAPFHYGRWWNHPTEGWIWFPGTQWAPSWVNWRSSGNFAGWAPLSPFADPGFGFSGGSALVSFQPGFDRFGLSRDNFTFVPMSRLGDRNLSRFRLNPAQVQRIFPQTTLVASTFATGAGNSILNRGIDPNLAQAASGSPILRVDVQDPALDFSGLTNDTTLADNSDFSGNGGGFFGPLDNGFGFSTVASLEEAALVESGLINGPPPSTAQSARINPRFPQPGQGLLDTGQPSTAQSQTINPAFPNLRPGPQLPNVPISGGGVPARRFFLAPFRPGNGTVVNGRARVTSPGSQNSPVVTGPFAPATGATPRTQGGPFAPAVGAAPAARGGAFAPAVGGTGGQR
ncbi:MAG: hypothetical protein JWR69_2486 [Pedosphaera sp.]|nr:hypothetical protein [Pedosphaera sp.]